MNVSNTDLSLIRPNLLENEGDIRAWFTLKNADIVSRDAIIPGLNLGFNTPEKKGIVVKNRLLLLSSLGLDHQWAAYADQVHSNRVQVVTQGGTYPSTDGLITKIPGITLGIQVADCAAVLLWDARNKVVAALHAGWRGAVGDIVLKGIEIMTDEGADPTKMKAFVSPCLSLKNFEVGMEVAEQFPDVFVDYEGFKKPHVDLKGFIKYQIKNAGISELDIEIRDECTVAEDSKFYSYRREGSQSGRMMALIQIAE